MDIVTPANARRTASSTNSLSTVSQHDSPPSADAATKSAASKVTFNDRRLAITFLVRSVASACRTFFCVVSKNAVIFATVNPARRKRLASAHSFSLRPDRVPIPPSAARSTHQHAGVPTERHHRRDHRRVHRLFKGTVLHQFHAQRQPRSRPSAYILAQRASATVVPVRKKPLITSSSRNSIPTPLMIGSTIA